LPIPATPASRDTLRGVAHVAGALRPPAPMAGTVTEAFLWSSALINMKIRTRSAGVAIVRFNEAVHCLLLRSYRYWDFPKGELAAGEDALTAARREVAEETGLDHLEFRWGDRFIETAPYGQGKVARYYVAESPAGDVRLPISPALGRPEHHEYRWVTPEAAEQLVNARLQPVLAWVWRTVGVDAGRA
jgi:8-oxo-dGTP pyrophosphatase MutT (NUDIX family)